MTNTQPPIVHWREGMFLRPQHLQAFARELAARIARADAFGRPGATGVAFLAVDGEALARDIFCLLEAELLFGDGTLATIPKTTCVEAREFAKLFTGDALDVQLGIPMATPNVSVIEEGGGRMARFRIEVQDLHDENQRDAQKPVEFRKLQARLFFGGEDTTGFECLPIARLVRKGRPVAESVLSPDYIPPVLTCGASPVLTGILKESAELLRVHARDLAATVPYMRSLGVTEKGADVAGLVKLQAVNCAHAPLAEIARQPELDPHTAYLALVQAIGYLSIFSEDRLVPDLLAFDPRRLGECFGQALAWIRRLAESQLAKPYATEPFVPDAIQQGEYRCDLDDALLDVGRTFYLGVELAADPRKAQGAVAKGVKLCAPRDRDRILQGVLNGCDLEFEQRPPLSFPVKPNLHYFRIGTEAASRAGWKNIVDDRVAVVLSTLHTKYAVSFHFYVELEQ